MTLSASATTILRSMVVLTGILHAACAPLPPAPVQRSASTIPPTSLPVAPRPSPNFDARRPNYVILHHTSDNTADEALRTLTSPTLKVSAHYLVGRDGRIYQLVDDIHRAWHAGESYWGGDRDLNSSSIGIELDNNGREPYAEAQIQALLALLADVKSRFNIPDANFLAHGDIAPGRKVDPGAIFPWQRLAQQGFGLWCDPPYPTPPSGTDPVLLLQAVGYSVWNVDAAFAAFKRHFVPEDPSPLMTEKDRAILYCLVLQKRALAGQ